MPTRNTKDTTKSAPATKKPVKDLPVRKSDADKVKGGMSAGHRTLP
jgi:hypothetical protein